jgi:hypothetical protein
MDVLKPRDLYLDTIGQQDQPAPQPGVQMYHIPPAVKGKGKEGADPQDHGEDHNA